MKEDAGFYSSIHPFLTEGYMKLYFENRKRLFGKYTCVAARPSFLGMGFSVLNYLPECFYDFVCRGLLNYEEIYKEIESGKMIF